MGAMKGMRLPILALWVGCCSVGALVREGLNGREHVAPPASAALPILQPPLSWSWSFKHYHWQEEEHLFCLWSALRLE